MKESFVPSRINYSNILFVVSHEQVLKSPTHFATLGSSLNGNVLFRESLAQIKNLREEKKEFIHKLSILTYPEL